MATLHIVRGLPGSGKSTFAKQLATQLGCKHFEADMFFTDENGNYNFDREKIGDAHEWCQNSVFAELHENRDVIVSNTFTTPREINTYLFEFEIVSPDVVQLHDVVIYEMTSEYGSVHNVPQEAMDRMKNRWVPNDKLQALIDEVVKVKFNKIGP